MLHCELPGLRKCAFCGLTNLQDDVELPCGHSDREAEISRLTARIAEMTWQPIDTAPRDGTVVDLWIDETRFADCYWGLPEHSCGEAEGYCDSEWHGMKDGWIDGTLNQPISELSFDQPSHWMPRPAAPVQARTTLEASERGGGE